MSSSLLNDAIRAAAFEVHGVTAQEFLDRLTERVADLLGADYVLVGRFDDAEQTRIRTLSLRARGAHAPALLYDLEGTPCARAVAEESCCYLANVANLFPRDRLLTEMKIEGYIGVRLHDTAGTSLGILAALFAKPIPESLPVRDLIAAFAPRAASEVARHRVEEENHRNEARLEAFRDLLGKTEQSDERQIIQAALEAAAALTGSRIGYFHFVDEPAGTIQLFTWTGNVMASCTAAQPGGYTIAEAGVWADCLRTRAPVIHNDYQNLPSKRGYPEGHSHVVRHLSVPVFDGDAIRMILGVGNKESFYDEFDVRQLERFASDVWLLIRRRRAEENLRRREMLAELMTDFSVRFIDLRIPDDASLHDLLAGLGRLLEADRTCLFLLDRDAKTLKNTHEWCAPGIEPQRAQNQEFSFATVPWWMTRIRRLETIEIPRVADLPADAAPERRLFEERGIRSLIAVPIHWGGVARGFIGLDTVRRERSWSAEEARDLRRIAETCSLVLERISAKNLLEDHLTFLRTLLDTIPAPVFSKDRAGRYSGCNRAFEEFLGRSAEEIIGLTVHEVAAPEFAKISHDADLDLLAHGGSQTYESRVVRADGGARDVIFHKAVILNDAGDADGIIGVITDITDRKRMEEDLRKLSRAVEQSQAAIVITDLEGRIEFANPAACRSTGYSFQELRGQNPRVLKSERTSSEEYKVLWQTISAGETWSGEFLNKRKDGSLYCERAVISPIRDDEGRPIRYVAVKEDITARKEAEQEVRDARDFLDKILQSTTNGIYVLDTEGRFTSVNDAAVRITGRPREELLGRHFGFLVPEEYAADVIDLFEGVVKNGHTRTGVELEILRADGSRAPLSISAAPLVTNDLLVGVVGAAEDITEKRLAVEERFASMEKEAMLGRLAAVVAHEVNNPLFAIKMQASSLAKSLAAASKDADRVKLILDQVDRISRTVKALLGLARRHGPGFVELDLRELIRSVILLYEVGFVSKGIALDLDLPEDLPPVRAVPDRIQEILVNLLENARQAIGANGRIGIRAAADETMVELIVDDSGPGLGDSADRVFKAHYTTKKEGTGLGLAIARRIVSEHHGSIVAENRTQAEGGGARFRVRLPRYEG